LRRQDAAKFGFLDAGLIVDRFAQAVLPGCVEMTRTARFRLYQRIISGEPDIPVQNEALFFFARFEALPLVSRAMTFRSLMRNPILISGS
jgi:hypothetical protein